MSVAKFKKTITISDGEFYVDGVQTNYLEIEDATDYDFDVTHTDLIWATWDDSAVYTFTPTVDETNTRVLTPANIFHQDHFDSSDVRSKVYYLHQCPIYAQQDTLASIFDQLSDTGLISTYAEDIISSNLLNQQIYQILEYDTTQFTSYSFDQIDPYASTSISDLEARIIAIGSGDVVVYGTDLQTTGVIKDGVKLSNGDDFSLRYDAHKSNYEVFLTAIVNASTVQIKSNLLQYASNNGISSGVISVRMPADDNRSFILNTTTYDITTSLVVKTVARAENHIQVHHMFDEWTRNTYPMFEDITKLYYDYEIQKGHVQEVVRNLVYYLDIDSAEESTIARLIRDSLGLEVLKSKDRFLLKRINDFMLAKGTEQSFAFLTNVMLGKQATLKKFSDDIFKTSSGVWYDTYTLTLSEADINNMISTYTTLASALDITGTVDVASVISAMPGCLVQGRTSKAFGVIDEIEAIEVNLGNFYKLKLQMKQGTLSQTERYDIRNDLDNFQINTDTITENEDSIVEVEVDYGGSGYTKGSKIVIDTLTGHNFEGYVSDVSPSGAIKDIEVIDGGWHYRATDSARVEFDSSPAIQTVDLTSNPVLSFEYGTSTAIQSVYYNDTNDCFAIARQPTALEPTVEIISRDGSVIKTFPTIASGFTGFVALAHEIVDGIHYVWGELDSAIGNGVVRVDEFGTITVYEYDLSLVSGGAWSEAKFISVRNNGIGIVADNGGNDWVLVFNRASLYDTAQPATPKNFFTVDASVNGNVKAFDINEEAIVVAAKTTTLSATQPTINVYTQDGASITNNTPLGITQSGVISGSADLKHVKYFINNNVRNVRLISTTGAAFDSIIETTHQYKIAVPEKAELTVVKGKLYRNKNGWTGNQSKSSSTQILQDNLKYQHFSVGVVVDEPTSVYLDPLVEKVGVTGFRYIGIYPTTLESSSRADQSATLMTVTTS